MNGAAWRLAGGLGLLTLVLPALAAAQEPPPLEAYGRLPGVEDIAISPSGTSLAMSASIRGARRIVVFGEPSELRWTIDADSIKFRGLRYINDDALLIFRSATVDTPGFAADQYELTQAIVLAPLRWERRG